MTAGGQPYAIVGGAACSVLGSLRQTVDVDFVVPKNTTANARALLRAAKTRFAVQSRTNHTTYLSSPPVAIEILTPPALFKENFSESTPTVIVNGNRVLKPTLLLNAKCASLLGRANIEKKGTDASDIRFLLTWCAENSMYPTASEVPNVTKTFVENFIKNYGGQDIWSKAGYNIKTGRRV
ncbi:hypothetical protein HIM_01008 [Hirsutella minnesotensis 3608]|nr:hypothetical protein HIM_01008 [Hirsutella minnesotensis 3608]